MEVGCVCGGARKAMDCSLVKHDGVLGIESGRSWWLWRWRRWWWCFFRFFLTFDVVLALLDTFAFVAGRRAGTRLGPDGIDEDTSATKSDDEAEARRRDLIDAVGCQWPLGARAASLV